MVACAVLYVGLWVGFANQWPMLATVDDWFLTPLHEYGLAHPGWVRGWDWFCIVLSPGAFRIAAVPVIILLWLRGHRRVALFLLLTIEISAIVTEFAKALADRPRPDTAMVSAMSSSFPSGHALGIMVIALALLTVLLPLTAPRWRPLVVALAAAVVLAIGVGRVVLNVHHPSDVLAGWALGYLYYLACLPVLREPAETPAALDTAK